MDVLKAKKYQHKLTKNVYAIGGILIAVIILIFWVIQSVKQASISRNDIIIDKVHQGNLDVIIDGYGSLKSNKQQLISSLSQATVKEIILKPGAIVKVDSIVVRLESTELNHEFESAKLQLAQVKSNLPQLKLNQERELLNETSRMEEAVSSYEKMHLKRIAYEKLIERGIVATIAYQEVMLDEQLLYKQADILKQRIAQLTLVHKEAIKVENEHIKQQEELFNIVQARLDGLNVKAGIDGVLQRLSVEIGQNVNPGQEIALIGSATDLVALIRIPQSEAQVAAVGQSAIVFTRDDQIKGKVFRIDPIVENNTVEIEISLPENLPPSALPQLNVDAKIIASTLENITYIKRPAKTQSNTQDNLYRLKDNQKQAEIQSLKFGRRAGDYIEILSGAKVNDIFIISDLSGLKSTSSKLNIN